jgi:hypothetical protein
MSHEFIATDVVLIGGIKARLCNPCINEVDAFLKADEGVQANKIRIHAKRNFFSHLSEIGETVTEEQFRGLAQEEHDNTAEFNKLVREWLNAPQSVDTVQAVARLESPE